MEWLVVVGAAGALIWGASRLLNNKEQDNRPVPPLEKLQRPAFTASVSLRSYDTEKYRFDGMAEPEFHIQYADDDGVITERDIFVLDWRKSGNITYYECWCFLRDQKRTLRSDRMLEITNLRTSRRVKDIAAYRMR